LPTYSSDLNPIEQGVAKLKALLSQVAERTYDKHLQTIGGIMDQFHTKKYLNYFKNPGYVFD